MRIFVFCCAVTLWAGVAFGQGDYQRTKDGRTTVWNAEPKPGDSAVWSGDRDAEGYATGPGTLVWYQAGGKVYGRYFGNMVKGRFDGEINVHSNGKTAHAIFIHGKRASGWARGPAPSRPEPAERLNAAVEPPEEVEKPEIKAPKAEVAVQKPPQKEPTVRKAEAVVASESVAPATPSVEVSPKAKPTIAEVPSTNNGEFSAEIKTEQSTPNPSIPEASPTQTVSASFSVLNAKAAPLTISSPRPTLAQIAVAPPLTMSSPRPTPVQVAVAPPLTVSSPRPALAQIAVAPLHSAETPTKQPLVESKPSAPNLPIPEATPTQTVSASFSALNTVAPRLTMSSPRPRLAQIAVEPPLSVSSPRPTPAQVAVAPLHSAETPGKKPAAESKPMRATDVAQAKSKMDESLRELVGPPASLHSKSIPTPTASLPPLIATPSATPNAGAHLTQEEAIALADREALNQGYELDEFRRPKADYSATDHKWSLFYDQKADNEMPEIGKYFAATVDDTTKKAEIKK